MPDQLFDDRLKPGELTVVFEGVEFTYANGEATAFTSVEGAYFDRRISSFPLRRAGKDSTTIVRSGAIDRARPSS